MTWLHTLSLIIIGGSVGAIVVVFFQEVARSWKEFARPCEHCESPLGVCKTELAKNNKPCCPLCFHPRSPTEL